MVRRSTRVAGCLVLLITHSLFVCSTEARETATGPLAEYVAKEDTSYTYTVRNTGRIGSTDYSELIMTSQTWRDVRWKHQLFILRPKSATAGTKHAMLFIAGGGWRTELEDPETKTRLPSEARLFAQLAEQMQTPIAVLLHCPHQPLFDGKYEDEIIAFTFEKFMRTRDPEWPLLLPMVKCAVRAMDTVQAYSRKTWAIEPQTFTVSGASKRGWTTWLTGAVDQRVTAIAPMVIDVLNMAPQMEHQKAAWGDVSYQIKDYTDRGLIEQQKTPAGRALRAIVDPYSYRQVLTQPKLIILGTNDYYWPLDALNLYWQDLRGPKHILYVPNEGHGIDDLMRLTGSLSAIHRQARTGEPLPQLRWEFNNGNSTVTLRVKSDKPATKLQAWLATAPTRDFREAKWKPLVMRAQEDGAGGMHTMRLPDEGYAAMFGEAMYAPREGLPFFLSTNVQIVEAQKQADSETK